MKTKEGCLGNKEEKKINDLFEFTNEKPQSYYEHNRESPYYISIDEKENAIDSLETTVSFLNRDDNLKWKWVVIALHHSLYSFCISALEHGNYEQVLTKGYDDDENFFVIIGNNKPKKSRIVPFYIKNYKTPSYRVEWDEVEGFPKHEKTKKKKRKGEKLIGFWTALARVQDNYYWMRSYSHTKAVVISDGELESICWITEKVRNDLSHFVPKGYSIDILSIIEAVRVILRIIEFLVFESYTILFLDHEISQKRIKETLELINVKLNVAEEIIHLHIIRDNHKVIKKK